jgi:hypothetical protein
MVRACSKNGEKKNAYVILVGKPEEKRPLGRSGCRWVKILKWVLERGDGMVRTGFIWPRIGTMEGIVNTVMNLRVP